MKRLLATVCVVLLLASSGEGAVSVARLVSYPGQVLPGYVTNDWVVDTEAELWLSAEIWISLTQGQIYQNPFGGDFPPPAGLLPAHPALEYDTYIAGGTLTTASETGSGAGIVGGAVDLGGQIPSTFSNSAIDTTWYPIESPTGFSTVGRFTFSSNAAGWYLMRLGFTDQEDPHFHVNAMYWGGPIRQGWFGGPEITPPPSPPLANGSFEMGNLYGWGAEGDSSLRIRDESPADGTYCASANVTACSGSNDGPDHEQGALLRDFSAEARESLLFDCRSEAWSDGDGVTDTSAWVELWYKGLWDDPAEECVFLEPIDSSVWTAFSASLQAKGNYTLKFFTSADAAGVPQGTLTLASSTLFVDNVRVVPEPSTALLLCSLGAALATFGIARRRKMASV